MNIALLRRIKTMHVMSFFSLEWKGRLLLLELLTDQSGLGLTQTS